MPTIWLSPTAYVTGDSSLQVMYPSASHPGSIVTSKTSGDLKWVSMGLQLPPNVSIDEITICYQISNANPQAPPPKSFISQVRLLEMSTPNQAIIHHDDPTDLKSTSPDSYVSKVGGLTPTAAITLTLRLNFQNITDWIILGAVSVKFEPAFAVQDWHLTGNTGANATVNFLGTTDNQALVIKTNGAESMVIAPDGKVAILGNLEIKGPRPWIDVRAYGAKGDADTNPYSNDTQALQGAINAAAGAIVYVPAGRYRITAPLTYVPTDAGPFVPGLQIIGDGSERTVFESCVADGSMIKIDTNIDTDAVGSACFQRGVILRGFQISGVGAQANNSNGIYLRHAHHVLLEDIRIRNLSGNGIYLPVTEGDTDGSWMVTLRRARIEACWGWGINADIPAGRNELSYLALENVLVHACGTRCTVARPPSGGMRWKGQVLHVQNSAFTENENVGFYNYLDMDDQKNAGNSQLIYMENSTFENNKRSSVRIEGALNPRFVNCQLYNNDNCIASHGFVLEPTPGGAILNPVITGTVVRASAGNNPYTAFKLVGDEVSYGRIERTQWNDFDHPGQRRFDDSGLKTEIFDDGSQYPYPSAAVHTTLSVPGATTPDLTRYKIHHIKLTTPGAYTIVEPSAHGAAFGLEMVLDFENASLGSVNVGFSGNWSVSGYVDPAPGRRTSALFCFDDEVGWIQIGSWR